MRGVAGHNVQRNFYAVALAGCVNFFQQDLKQRRIGNRADGIHSLGMVEAQACTLTPGDEDRADFAFMQSLLTSGAGVGGRELTVVIVEANCLRRLGAVG